MGREPFETEAAGSEPLAEATKKKKKMEQIIFWEEEIKKKGDNSPSADRISSSKR